MTFICYWKAKVNWPITRFINILNLSSPRYYDWCKRLGQDNICQQKQPRNHWLLSQEREAIIAYAKDNPTEGYRRLCYMMIDESIAATSPTTVYRVLRDADMLLEARGCKISKKGTGFNQPKEPHEHWHSDISYLNIAGTFFYFISVLDGYSRYMVHWELREKMEERDIELVIERALEKFPSKKTRVISDNGKQYTANDFKKFIRLHELSHVTTSPYYPQSNGKIERFHRTLKHDGIKHGDLITIETARARLTKYINYYNNERLHAAIDYITPYDKLNGNEQNIFDERKISIEQAKLKRKKVHEQEKIGGAKTSPVRTPLGTVNTAA